MWKFSYYTETATNTDSLRILFYFALCNDGSRIFTGGGGYLQGAPEYVLIKISEKLYEIEKIWLWGVCGGGGAPGDPRSATALSVSLSLCPGQRKCTISFLRGKLMYTQ